MHYVRTDAHIKNRTRLYLKCFCFSPALVDVDAVYFVGTDRNLGQGLNHVVALQNHVSLGRKNHHTGTQWGLTAERVYSHTKLHLVSGSFITRPLASPSVCCRHWARAGQTSRHWESWLRHLQGKDSFNEWWTQHRLHLKETPPVANDNWLLTFQSSVVDALLEFGLLYDESTVGGEQQLAGPSLVAFSVVLGDWHCILGTEGWRSKPPINKYTCRKPDLFCDVAPLTFIFSLPRACTTLGLMSSPSEQEETCC